MSLIVINSQSATNADIVIPDIGPKNIAPMVITASLGSKVRNCTGKWKIKVLMYANAENIAITVSFLMLDLFDFMKNPLSLKGGTTFAVSKIIFYHPDYTVGTGI